MNRAAFGLAVLLLTAPGREASASHYDLSAIDIVDAAAARRLAEARVFTTEDLWKATATPRLVSKLSRQARIPVKQLRELHDFCDLLRVGGIGPKVARVLTLCGVANLTVMARQDASDLTRRVKEANAKHGILGKVPDEDSVRTWIARAVDLTRPVKAASSPGSR